MESNVQDEQPSVTAPKILTDITLYAELESWIKKLDPKAEVDEEFIINITCSLCLVRTLDFKQGSCNGEHIVPEDEETPEPTAVLSCGHIFGFHCISEWFWEKISQNECPNCPICREEEEHPGCGCEIAPKVIPNLNPYMTPYDEERGDDFSWYEPFVWFWREQQGAIKEPPFELLSGMSTGEFCKECEEEILDYVL